MPKHHYVAQFYQKGFADSDGLVWVYDRVLKTCKRLPPVVVCVTKDFYAVRPEGTPPDQRIETDILTRMESRAAPVILKIEKGTPLTLEDAAHLSIFVGMQYTRVPTFARGVTSAVETLMREKIRIEFLNVERAAATLTRDREAFGEVANIEPEAFVKYVNSPNFKMSATERPFLEAMFEQAMSLSTFIGQSHWKILRAPDESGFITSDNAFVPVPPRGFDLASTGSGYGLPGATNYFPLTRRTCLELRHGGRGYCDQRVDRRYVRAVNRNVAATSDRFIIGGSERQLKTLVEDCGVDSKPYSERISVEVVISNDHESLIKYERKHPPMYFYPPE